MLRELSSPMPSGPAAEAARRLLSSDSPDTELDRLYPAMVRHHVAPAVIDALRTAGGDLDDLTVSGDLVRTLWPLSRLLPEPVETPSGRVPLSGMALAIDRHTAHLDTLAWGLSGEGSSEAVVLLFGGALRLLVPEYRRLSNDLDLYAPGAREGWALVKALWDRWGFVLVRQRTSRSLGRTLGHFKLLRTTDDGHQLHVDVIAGGRPAGPGLLPPFVLPGLLARSRKMAISGREVLVPSIEDLLAMLGEKVLRRGALHLRDVHDAWMLAANASYPIDWSCVVEASTRHGLRGVMSHLLAAAEREHGPAPIDPEVRAALRPGFPWTRLLSGDVSPTWRRAWAVSMLARELAHPSRYGPLAADRLRGLVLKQSSRVARVVVGRDVKRLYGRAGDQALMIGSLPDPKRSTRPWQRPPPRVRPASLPAGSGVVSGGRRTGGPLVVIEGTNAVGKSSVASDLARRLQAPLFHFPPAFVQFREEVALDEAVAPIPRLVYYFGGILHLSALVHEAMVAGPVICDRYAASPLGAVVADGETAEHEIRSLFASFEPFVLRPDLTILLRCDHRTAQARLQARSRLDGSLNVLHQRSLDSPEYFRRTHQAIRRQVYRMGPVAEIDTSDRTVEETGEAAWRVVRSRVLGE
jgi:thymidylate kinase